MTNPEQGILAALAYTEVFRYPLTPEEIYYWFVGSRISKRRFHEEFTRIRDQLPETNGYFLLNRCTAADLRNRRLRNIWSLQKIERFQAVLSVLTTLPTVDFIGITGSVGALNADHEADIDLLVVSCPGSLWLTRFMVTVALELLRVRRRPRDADVTNLACANMFMERGSLELPRGERNLYTAHESLHMQPVFDRNGTYRDFLTSNSWIRRLLPHAFHERIRQAAERRTQHVSGGVQRPSTIRTIGEAVVRGLQIRYMMPRVTNEIITDHYIRFHPHDIRQSIFREFSGIARRRNISLDKIFYPP